MGKQKNESILTVLVLALEIPSQDRGEGQQIRKKLASHPKMFYLLIKNIANIPGFQEF